MRAIVGLGNPGERYARTRHNIGFRAVDALAEATGAQPFRERLGSLVAESRIEGEPVLLAKPLSFMNLSGGPVQALMARHRLRPQEVFVVLDDVLLEPGRFRARSGGSHGGHNGLRSIEGAVGRDYGRLRVGCGPCPPGIDLADFVLRRLAEEEMAAIDGRMVVLPEVFSLWFRKGVDAVAQSFNGPPPGSRPPPATGSPRQ